MVLSMIRILLLRIHGIIHQILRELLGLIPEQLATFPGDLVFPNGNTSSDLIQLTHIQHHYQHLRLYPLLMPPITHSIQTYQLREMVMSMWTMVILQNIVRMPTVRNYGSIVELEGEQISIGGSSKCTP